MHQVGGCWALSAHLFSYDSVRLVYESTDEFAFAPALSVAIYHRILAGGKSFDYTMVDHFIPCRI